MKRVQASYTNESKLIFDAWTKATQRSKDSFFQLVVEHLGAQAQKKKKKNIDMNLTHFTNIIIKIKISDPNTKHKTIQKSQKIAQQNLNGIR